MKKDLWLLLGLLYAFTSTSVRASPVVLDSEFLAPGESGVSFEYLLFSSKADGFFSTSLISAVYKSELLRNAAIARYQLGIGDAVNVTAAIPYQIFVHQNESLENKLKRVEYRVTGKGFMDPSIRIKARLANKKLLSISSFASVSIPVADDTIAIAEIKEDDVIIQNGKPGAAGQGNIDLDAGFFLLSKLNHWLKVQTVLSYNYSASKLSGGAKVDQGDSLNFSLTSLMNIKSWLALSVEGRAGHQFEGNSGSLISLSSQFVGVSAGLHLRPFKNLLIGIQGGYGRVLGLRRVDQANDLSYRIDNSVAPAGGFRISHSF
ncbi:MAG: hypothetical protein OEZ43_03965 [Gammaproteobacteria bacterium]|nr:hypothetical protein [Gammaproteobacteria bacterium]